jgi:hypothetical protein
MARGAIVREATRYVIRICRFRKVRRVTCITIRILDGIVSVRMATLAWRRRMRSRQWECRL